MTNPRTIEQVIGAEVKRLRLAAGKGQGEIALAAQRFGLDWAQGQVSALEGGRRELGIGVLMLLPIVLWSAGLQSAPGLKTNGLSELIPATDEEVLLAPGVLAPLRTVRAFYATTKERQALGTPPPLRISSAGLRVTEVDRAVARKLGVSTTAIVTAAERLWGRDLVEERAHRVKTPGASPQKYGRVTRELIAELKPTIKPRRRRRT